MKRKTAILICIVLLITLGLSGCREKVNDVSESETDNQKKIFYKYRLTIPPPIMNTIIYVG